MLIKYKAGDVAKDLGQPAKQVLELLGEKLGEQKKHTQPLTEEELNFVFEHYTKEYEAASLDEYLACFSAPKKETAEKAAEKKPEKKQPAAPKNAEKKPQAQPEKPALQPAAEKVAEEKPAAGKPVQEKAAPAQAEKKPAEGSAQTKPETVSEKKQPEKPARQKPAAPMGGPLRRADGSLVEAKNSGKKAEKENKETAKPAEQRRETVTMTVDTRTSEVNLDKYNEKYDTLAGAGTRGAAQASGKHGKNAVGGKQKFANRPGKFGGKGPQGKKRETEAERLQRLQLEKARKAQLKVSIPDEITVGELASRLKQTAANVIKKLMGLGVMASVSEVIDFDTACLVAEELGAKVEHEVHVTIEERLFENEQDDPATLEERPPVVVVMGHVDHGKTSILDAIRATRVTEGEAGGITQAIGAYQVVKDGKAITFLDTPGHEAFTSMRARGANLTDIAVLVVAADDGIMPQTVESINHAKAADTTIIVAISKMDKPTANPERVKEQLTQYELVPEDWGGDTICVPVSALTGMGIDDLLDTINLVAEVKELKANPHRRAKGAVVEARLDKGQGAVATVLVQNGTLHKGDSIIAGTVVGRVRTMRNDKGELIESAGPSTPVEITGLTDVPAAGDLFEAVEDERLARELASQRADAQKQEQFNQYKKVTLDNLFSQIAEGERKELPIVVKADVQGSAEAVKQSLEKISNDEVRVKVIHAGVGAISKSDVMLASASGAIIIGFNVRPDPVAKVEAAQAEVEMRMYRVIYDAINDVTDAMKGMLAPKIREVELGRIEVRNVFKISSAGTIAGSYVLEGKVTRGSKIRVVRDGIVLAEDEIDSLRRFKDDVKEVAAGYECGIGLDKFSDIKEGDIFEAFVLEEYRD
ncbi:MAG: translation initiation factor IF-2 [Pygmaiobacter massiliensis]|nr:translation initiation factor IF-2 [Pygmaiobacter massiliensis]